MSPTEAVLLTMLLSLSVSPPWLRMPPPLDGTRSSTVGDGETRDSDLRSEIFKPAVGGVAVHSQTSSTRAVDGHVVGNLKFAAGQENGAEHAGGVNRVAVIRDGERITQRAGPAVIGVRDYDDVSWQPVAAFTSRLFALPSFARLWFSSVSLR